MEPTNRTPPYELVIMNENHFNEPEFPMEEHNAAHHIFKPSGDVERPYSRSPMSMPLGRVYLPRRDQNEQVKRYIGSGVAFASILAENLLCHPFLVLRRQCQVNHSTLNYHLFPFTLLPIIYFVHQRQGITTLWKGLGSALIVRGMSIGFEDFISKITPWPRALSSRSTLKQFFQHIMLKCLGFAAITPFYSASFVETVQSDIASETPGMLDIFRQGFMRLLNWGVPAKGRMLPIWALIAPTVALGLSKYLLSLLIQGVIKYVASRRVQDADEFDEDVVRSTRTKEEIDLYASLFANITSEIIFYPCETIVNRLHLQGTRTIIDNLSDGKSVLPILTNYTGAFDCFEKCVATEGCRGLYKGIGALVLQYLAHIALIKLSRIVLLEIGSLLNRADAKPPAVKYSPPVISNITERQESLLDG